MKKISLLAFLPLFLLVPGCGHNKDKRAKTHKKDLSREVDIPITQDTSEVTESFFFDDDIDEFVLNENESLDQVVGDDVAFVDEFDLSFDEAEAPLEDTNEFAWVEVDQEQEAENFERVYFDFDNFALRDDQEEIVQKNVDLAKKMLEQAIEDGEDPTLVISGHACSSAGSATYNLALSEKRALKLKQRFVEAGVNEERIKIIGLGSEAPVFVNGEPLAGNREQQAPNRRDELRIVLS